MSRRAVTRRAGRALCAALLVAAALVHAGCAPLPPARQVTDINLIAGRWQGQIVFGRGSYQLFYLTINPDSTLVASWDGVTRWGKVTLEGGGDRVILLKEDFSHWDAIVRPLK